MRAIVVLVLMELLVSQQAELMLVYAPNSILELTVKYV